MGEFRSIFAVELHDYISIRQMTLEEDTIRINRNVLRDFDNYFLKHGDSTKEVTEDLINGWIQNQSGRYHSRTVSDRVSTLRCFLKYLRYCGVPVFMPQCPKWHDDYVPYIFSDSEMNTIIRYADETVCKRGNRSSFKIAMLIRLLYGCGLRHGETLQIIRSDIDFEHGTLLLRKPKNKKQRIVPMHQSLAEILMRYCAAIGIYDKPDAFLFPGLKSDSPVSQGTMSESFKNILKASNIYVPPDNPRRRGQCLHCLRHVFAVNSFMQAEKNGRSTSDSVPYLSVYLGHFDMDGTEKYLKFSSDIFPEHTEMFEDYSSGVFSVIGGAE